MKNLVIVSALLLFSILLSASSKAATSFYAPVLVTATATSTLVMTPNASRTYLIIVNTGSQPVIAKFGSPQTALEGIPIPAGGSYEPIQAPANGVWLETASSTSTVTLIQGVAQ